jgi:polyhydroxyalkanoate synthesis regulator phasin
MIKESSMFKILEKMMYAGVGAAAITEEKARELVNELEKKGHVSGEEASKMVKDLVERGKASSEEIQKAVFGEVKKIMTQWQFVKKEDFDALAKEVHDLNVKMDILLSHDKH